MTDNKDQISRNKFKESAVNPPPEKEPTPRVIQLGMFADTDKDVTNAIVEGTNDAELANESSVEEQPELEATVITLEQIIQNRTDAVIAQKGIYGPKNDASLQNLIKLHEAEQKEAAQNSNSDIKPSGPSF